MAFPGGQEPAQALVVGPLSFLPPSLPLDSTSLWRVPGSNFPSSILFPPGPPNHTGPSPGPLGQSRLHTLTLVPEGPHGDAVLPHEAPHSTTIALHAWISEVQWLGGLATALDPGSPPSQGMALVSGSQVTSFFMPMRNKRSKEQGASREGTDSPRPLQVPGGAIPGWPLLLPEDWSSRP